MEKTKWKARVAERTGLVLMVGVLWVIENISMIELMHVLNPQERYT